MSGREWTQPQLAAITSVGKSLLVSAAAGSGKTSVLAERCAHLVCDANPRCNVGQLLVVTFTEAAAGEMRGRIEQALRQRLANSPRDLHIKKQLSLVDHASISTLHSFCNRLLRQHFHKAALDPSFRVLDDDESTLLRLDTVRDLFMDCYDREEAQAFREFIDAFGEGEDDRLMGQVIRVYELLRSLVDPMGWMDRSITRIELASKLPLESSDLGKEYLAIVRQQLSDLLRDTRGALDAIARLQAFPQYVSHLQTVSKTLESWSALLARSGYDALVDAAASFPGLPKLASVPNAAPGKDVAKAQVDAVNKQFKEGPLARSLRFTAAQWQAALASTLPHARVFLKLIDEFARRYRAQKQEVRAVDFADLERFTFTLLNDAKRGEPVRPSAIARYCQKQFQHVLVDEYQDINELQDAILALLSRESAGPSATPNLFRVGDVKQSIYGFRLAEPALFLNEQSKIKSQKSQVPSLLIDLQANFRSRAPLLDVMNAIFERLMTAQAVDIDYDQTQRLHPRASFPPAHEHAFTGSPVELHLLPKDARSEDHDEDPQDAELERDEREAVLIARRIQELMGQFDSPRKMVCVRDRNGELTTRPLEYRDIVILLRATRFHADQYASVLRQAGIRVYNAGGGGYFDAMEVRDVLSLLRLMDNQRQDIPLAAVLRSPLSGMPAPEDSLARIRLACPDPRLPFHEAVAKYAAEQDDELAAKLRDFLAELKEWRNLARQRPIAQVLWQIYEQTGFLAFCSGLENGPQRCANLLRLHQRARQFGSFSRQGLYRFNRFLESLDEETDPAQASELGEGEDVVRIMSIHKSKGLEFPVVIIPALGKRINLQDASGRILADRHAHLGLETIDLDRRIRYPSLASTVVSSRIRRNALAEEMRVLYVALTRAKEHLILVGTCPAGQNDQWARKWDLHEGPLPAGAILSAHAMLDWIGPVAAALSSQDGGKSILTIDHPPEALGQWIESLPRAKSRPEIPAPIARLTPLAPAPTPTPTAQHVITRLTQTYPFTAFTALPASQAVTSLTKSAIQIPKSKIQIASSELSPADRGQSTHTFLQHLDFSRAASDEHLQDQLAHLIDMKLLTPPQARAIDLETVRWFLSTEMGQMLGRRSQALLREVPLSFPRAKLPSADPRDQVMVRGRLDLLLPDDAGLLLLDYKTDQVTPAQLAARTDHYRPQIELYRQAISRILSRPVHTALLVFLSPRQIVPVSPG